MRFISTRGRSSPVSFRTALLAGMASDGGLYVPDGFARLPFDKLRGGSLVEVGVTIARYLIGHDVPRPALERLLTDALNFPLPLVPLAGGPSALELFHGPTFAFKDVGARVMARLMAHFNDTGDLTVLVATSGDTGSAIAQAFFGLAGTRVVVLFPEGGVTPVQEAQFTTLGGNVTAVAVAGTFDDCQRLAKEAFADGQLRDQARLTSANSINIGRLLPQAFYYAHAAVQLQPQKVIFSVPSGNFGNLTAGLFAWKLGAPIAGFVAATTVNDTLPRYLASGDYEPRPSIATLANAMDVGDPSNVERMRWLFSDDVASMREVVISSVHTDSDVRVGIKLAWERHGYVCDPHSAIGYLGTFTPNLPADAARVFLATAHPAKFRETVEPVLGQIIPLPQALADAVNRPRSVERIGPTLARLRPLLVR